MEVVVVPSVIVIIAYSSTGQENATPAADRLESEIAPLMAFNCGNVTDVRVVFVGEKGPLMDTILSKLIVIAPEKDPKLDAESPSYPNNEPLAPPTGTMSTAPPI